jgi:hypothetical protein
MKVPVFIKYSKIEELCDHDEQEGIICDDFRGYVGVDVSDVELNRNDLEKLVREYLDDIADILKADKRLLDELLRKLNINLNTW